MQALNRTAVGDPEHGKPRILQFGAGNFLRGYFDWMVERVNQATGDPMGVLVVKPTEQGDYQALREQEGLYHVLTQGLQDGEAVSSAELITCVQDVLHPYRQWEQFLQSAEQKDLHLIVSNTTEAGIRFVEEPFTDQCPTEFPAKLTRWLYRRFAHAQGDPAWGCTMLPLELIEDNGVRLRDAVMAYTDHWGLPQPFGHWIDKHNFFCNTLVDRIVTGYPEEQAQAHQTNLGWQDELLVCAEPFHLLVIDGPAHLPEVLPLGAAGLNVIHTEDIHAHRTVKVRLLNGAHAAMVPVGYLAGCRTVRECMEHPQMGRFVHDFLYDEAITSLDLPDLDLTAYAQDVLERFKNPFIKHQLSAIALNLVPKFGTRLLPTLDQLAQEGMALPPKLTFALASLLRFYGPSWHGKVLPVNDAPQIVERFREAWDLFGEAPERLSSALLSQKELWGKDLAEIPQLVERVSRHLADMEARPFDEALGQLFAVE